MKSLSYFYKHTEFEMFYKTFFCFTLKCFQQGFFILAYCGLSSMIGILHSIVALICMSC